MASTQSLSQSPDPVLTGGCMCGSVTYTSTVLPSSMTNCHCTTCRKLSGAPFLTFAQFPTAAITFSSFPTLSSSSSSSTATSASPSSTSGALKTVKYTDLASRGHCSECGSHLFMKYACQPQKTYMTAGSIDESSVKGKLPKPDHHIFVAAGEKAGWYDIEDRLPKSERFSAAFQRKIDDWKEVLLRAPGLG